MRFNYKILFYISVISILNFNVKANGLQDILSKYCISSSSDKGYCTTDKEAHYESYKSGYRCRCGDANSNTYNYWDKSKRECKSCSEGYIRDENTLAGCVKVECPPGYGLEKVSKVECPNGSEINYLYGG